MDKKSAQKLVKDTLEHSFSKEKFTYLIKNLLNNFNEEKIFTYKGNLIPRAFKDSIKTLNRIGQFKDSENHIIDILIVQLKKETILERARTKQRNFISWYLKSRTPILKDGALSAFVSPNEEDWRFSFVKMEYKYDTEKKKIREDFTPARRYSFLVGKNESSHTAQSSLVPLLMNDEEKPSLTSLEDAFSVEKVTKEFYEKYRKLFDNLISALDEIIKKDKKIRKDFENKEIDSVNFAKKLLGQIVFLYFLQKKGWFGVNRDQKWGEGSKAFLRELFNRRKDIYKAQGSESSQNFFNDILEPLFYEALGREHEEDYYSRFNCRIPFLNGGLFEPINSYDWVNTDILLPDSLFSNNNTTKEGDVGNGIMDIFDRYNFTVKEDEPLEKEVAVDPEMLGKVFENLLPVKDRKSKGTYYTPREIVHYMCQESLINYLAEELNKKVTKGEIEKFIKISDSSVEHDTIHLKKKFEDKTYRGRYKKAGLPDGIKNQAPLIDKKLTSIKVCDPAVGSGAFPVGMMNEIVRARTALSPYIKSNKNNRSTKHPSDARTSYYFKRHVIENSLYGVDVDPGAIEIAKLRLWLSLIVDEEERETIQPLPNLDYKMICGNSLFEGILSGHEKSFSDPKREHLVIQLKKCKDKFIRITTHKTKRNLLNEIKKLTKTLYEYDIDQKIKALDLEMKEQISQTKLFSDKDSQKKEKSQLKEHKSKIQDLENRKSRYYFEWRIDFSEVFQEKQGFDVVIANPPYVKEGINKLAFDGLRSSPYYQGKMDLWYFFACKGIDISRPDAGVIAFIAQNNWVTSFGASKMRNKIIKDTQILNLIDFVDFKVFEAGIQTMIMLFKHSSSVEKYTFDYRKLSNKNSKFKDLVSVLNKEETINAEYMNPKIDRSNLKDKKLTFSNLKNEKILNKLLKYHSFKLTNTEVGKAIEYNIDHIKKKHIEILGDQSKVGDGVFILSDKEKNNLSLTKKELSLLKPYYTTKELGRWSGNPKNKEWVIYTDSTFKNPKKMKEYPNIKKHLDQFQKIITSDNKPYGINRTRKESFFIGEKIISLRKCAKPTFTYVDFDSYVSSTFYVIKVSRLNLKYLTGILNSKLIAFWLKHKGKMQGSNYQIDKEPIMEIPLIKSSESKQKPLINLVDKILAITKTKDYLQSPNKQTQVQKYEKQIDQLVYKLYELTPEEIKIIEDS